MGLTSHVIATVRAYTLLITVWDWNMLYPLYMPLVRLVLRLFLRVLGGLDVQGLEHVPRKGGLLVAPTHQSHVDPIIMGAVLPRDAWYVATEDLFSIRWVGPLAAALRAFPIRQDTPDLPAIRRVQALAEAGEAVVIFPEGHESPDGSLQPLQPGTVFVALRSGTPILPIAIRYSNRMMPYASWRPRRAGRRAIVRIGPPIDLAELSVLPKHQAVEVAMSRLRAALQGLIDRAEPPGREPISEGIA